MKSFEKITEGKALIFVPKEKKVSKKLSVFYNPVMKLNRDISILILNALDNKDMQIAFPLAGSGVRGVRFLLELKKNKIKNINFNDMNPNAIKTIKENLKLNKIKQTKNITIHQQDANQFILESTGFDYIDIDPFGTPNPFLDSAVKRISRGGILAVTATDTSALAGSYPSACRRKYWAEPLRNEIKHEAGIRILARKVQLIGAQFDKALTPIYSYSNLHYMRIFFKCDKGKNKVDVMLKQHGMFNTAGPLWLGQLWDKKIAVAIAKQTDEKLVKTIANESRIDTTGFFDTHAICKKIKKQEIPPRDEIIKQIKARKHMATQTHFSLTGIRTTISEQELIKIIKTIK